MKQLMGFFRSGREKSGTFESGIETALAFILVSPQFLFRFEMDPDNVATGASYRISDLELASRLSFFILEQHSRRSISRSRHQATVEGTRCP